MQLCWNAGFRSDDPMTESDSPPVSIVDAHIHFKGHEANGHRRLLRLIGGAAADCSGLDAEA